MNPHTKEARMRSATSRSISVTLLIAAWILGACAGSTQTTATDGGPPYGSFLVIGIAGDYDGRAQFERELVSLLRRQGASATTYYSVVGSNQPITRDSVREALQTGDFDAIVVTRVLDEQTDIKIKKSREGTDASTIGGRFFNLFRSDYTDYKIPGSIDLTTRIVFATELYDAATEEVVWSAESSSKGETNEGLLITRTAETVVSRLKREKAIEK